MLLGAVLRLFVLMAFLEDRAGAAGALPAAGKLGSGFRLHAGKSGDRSFFGLGRPARQLGAVGAKRFDLGRGPAMPVCIRLHKGIGARARLVQA